jgi:hypothetical protein
MYFHVSYCGIPSCSSGKFFPFSHFLLGLRGLRCFFLLYKNFVSVLEYKQLLTRYPVILTSLSPKYI